MRPILPSAALLAAAFLLGCQERGSGPVGPEGLGVLVDKTGPHPHGGGGGGDKKKDLIEVGRTLFFEETFNGNGRTRGACHFNAVSLN